MPLAPRLGLWMSDLQEVSAAETANSVVLTRQGATEQESEPVRGLPLLLGTLRGMRSISTAAHLNATKRRLEAARLTGEASVMMSALQAVDDMRPHGVGIPQKLHALSSSIRYSLQNDDALRCQAQLRRSRAVKRAVSRFWDLMVAESSDGHAPIADASREGYCEVQHRLRLALQPRGADFYRSTALEQAEKDWTDAIANFSSSSHITIWLDTIRTRFQQAAADAVARSGFNALFSRYDADGNGELDADELNQAVRNDLGVTAEQLSNKEIQQLFQIVDNDASGSIDAAEFIEWLFAKQTKKKKQRVMTHGGLKRQRVDELKQKFKAAAAATSQCLGWEMIFHAYDVDESGELELEEFTRAVRRECGLGRGVVNDDEVREIFDVIDVDHSGAIDSIELQSFLSADLGAQTISFKALLASMCNIIEGAVHSQTESAWVELLQWLFTAVTVPVNGHTLAEPGLEDLAVYQRQPSQAKQEKNEGQEAEEQQQEEEQAGFNPAHHVRNFELCALDQCRPLPPSDQVSAVAASASAAAAAAVEHDPAEGRPSEREIENLPEPEPEPEPEPQLPQGFFDMQQRQEEQDLTKNAAEAEWMRRRHSVLAAQSLLDLNDDGKLAESTPLLAMWDEEEQVSSSSSSPTTGARTAAAAKGRRRGEKQANRRDNAAAAPMKTVAARDRKRDNSGADLAAAEQKVAKQRARLKGERELERVRKQAAREAERSAARERGRAELVAARAAQRQQQRQQQQQQQQEEEEKSAQLQPVAAARAAADEAAALKAVAQAAKEPATVTADVCGEQKEDASPLAFSDDEIEFPVSDGTDNSINRPCSPPPPPPPATNRARSSARRRRKTKSISGSPGGWGDAAAVWRSGRASCAGFRYDTVHGQPLVQMPRPLAAVHGNHPASPSTQHGNQSPLVQAKVQAQQRKSADSSAVIRAVIGGSPEQQQEKAAELLRPATAESLCSTLSSSTAGWQRSVAEAVSDPSLRIGDGRLLGFRPRTASWVTSSSSGSGESLPFTRGNGAAAVSARRRPYTAAANPAAALAIGSATGLCAQQGQPLFSREPGAAGASYKLAQRPSSREARRPSTGWFRAQQPVRAAALQPVVGQRI